ncbi:hypothetical protein [Streptococcus pyogenes]|uniref:hypothetical protein n=1 Tax=Streptococcus pyogenes TaxID=1314 RepID=UPI0016446A5B|nr:hypothetical protein [Streptococcus pyogenes]
MKTRSKRFLNLATLCLALLGTALLMAHPVKAEVMSKEEYMTRFELGDLGDDSALEARYKGYLEGYEKGFNGDDMPKRTGIEVSEGVQPSYGDDYRDGYEEGYGQGRHEGHPVKAFLEDLWGFLTNVFGGWFGEDQES